MRSKADTHSEEAEKAVRDIRRATRRLYSAEEKVRGVIAGLRGEDSVAGWPAIPRDPELPQGAPHRRSPSEKDSATI